MIYDVSVVENFHSIDVELPPDDHLEEIYHSQEVFLQIDNERCNRQLRRENDK